MKVAFKHGKTTITIFMTIIVTVLLSGCHSKEADRAENRAVWLHPGIFSADADTALRQMTDLFDSYRDAGINNLFCYNSLKDENAFQWDYLQALIDEGHARGIKIHPIICPGYPVRIEGEIAEHPEWMVVKIDSTTGNQLNPALPAVHDYWLRRVSEAMKYDIDGIHLDYARFAIDQKYSYDTVTTGEFSRIYGSSPIDVAHDCGSMIWCEWIKWNGAQMTKLIVEINDLIASSEKDLLLGVDVFPDYETAQVMIGQEWDEWASEGNVDFICPMLYTNDTALFREYIGRAVDVAGGRCQVWAGVGLRTSHNIITPDLMISEMEISREVGAQGVAFFSGYSLSKELRERLCEVVPQRQWD
ncbi:MAG: family 10 glycosylhydrolase [Bacteroidales bacterium]